MTVAKIKMRVVGSDKEKNENPEGVRDDSPNLHERYAKEARAKKLEFDTKVRSRSRSRSPRGRDVA